MHYQRPIITIEDIKLNTLLLCLRGSNLPSVFFEKNPEDNIYLEYNTSQSSKCQFADPALIHSNTVSTFSHFLMNSFLFRTGADLTTQDGVMSKF